MVRRRLTQIFPFLLPIRQWQRKKLFYLKMEFDGNRYAKIISRDLLPNKVIETASPMLNQKSGFDMQYQYNKVHNLKLAAKTVDGLIIQPEETFSFWQLARHADRNEKYKDGLNLVDGKIVGSYGGGLCQLSNLLFWMFLHTPLTIVERHSHTVESFPSTTEDLPCGTDATINEGWLDLKVRNDTSNRFQIRIFFDDKVMYGEILSTEPVDTEYTVFNSMVSYKRQHGKIYQVSDVCRIEKNKKTGKKTERKLYTNRCEIGYVLPEGTKIEDGGK